VKLGYFSVFLCADYKHVTGNVMSSAVFFEKHCDVFENMNCVSSQTFNLDVGRHAAFG
jgi:hypothetical protein